VGDWDSKFDHPQNQEKLHKKILITHQVMLSPIAASPKKRMQNPKKSSQTVMHI
jgi:hypothetical protein